MYSERRKLHRQRKFKRVILPLLWLLIIAAIVYFIYFSGIFEIKKVVVLAGEKSEEFTDYLKIVQNPLYKNFILFPRWQVRSSFKNGFPEVEKVSFFSDLKTKTFRVVVGFREPTFLVCSIQCFISDKDGFLFRQASPNEEGTSSLIVKIIEEKQLSIKDSLGKETLSALSLISQNLQKLNFGIFKIASIKKNNDIEISFENRPALFFTPSLSFTEQFNKLERFLTNEELRKDFDLSKIEYIDLRIPEKIFVK